MHRFHLKDTTLYPTWIFTTLLRFHFKKTPGSAARPEPRVDLMSAFSGSAQGRLPRWLDSAKVRGEDRSFPSTVWSLSMALENTLVMDDFSMKTSIYSQLFMAMFEYRRGN